MVKKIGSPEELMKLRDQTRAELDLRGGPKEIQITVHMGTCGIAAGARDVLTALADELGRVGITNVTLRRSGCIGLCDQEPIMTLADQSGKEYRYVKLDKKKVHEIIRDHVAGGNPVINYLIKA
jgi:NADP-reducing hydrogenase subunit HndB